MSEPSISCPTCGNSSWIRKLHGWLCKRCKSFVDSYQMERLEKKHTHTERAETADEIWYRKHYRTLEE